MRSPRAATIALIRALRAAKLRPRRHKLPRQVHPLVVQVDYLKRIKREVLEPARALVMAELLPVIREVLAGRTDAHAREDAGSNKLINKALDAITKKFYSSAFHPRAVEALAEEFAQRTSSFQRRQLDAQVRAGLGVDVLHNEPPAVARTMDDFVGENVALIKSIPSTYFSDIEKVVTREVNAGTRHEDIAGILEDRYGVAENRAKLIARDQVGKLYGQLNSVRQQAMGVTGFTWRTVHDNRVREEHAALDGQFFTWDDPPDEGIPGEAINCRCWADPDFSAILGDASDD